MEGFGSDRRDPRPTHKLQTDAPSGCRAPCRKPALFSYQCYSKSSQPHLGWAPGRSPCGELGPMPALQGRGGERRRLSPSRAMSLREGATASVGCRPLRDSVPPSYASQTNVAGAEDASFPLSDHVEFREKDGVARVPHMPMDQASEEGEGGASLVAVGGRGWLPRVRGVWLLPRAALPHLSPVAWALRAAPCLPRQRAGAGGILH